MKIRVLCISLIMALNFSFISQARADEDEWYARWFAGLGAGIISPNVSHRTNFANSGMPGFPDDKYVTTNWTQSPFVSLLGGYQWQYADTVWLPAMSLALQYTYSQPQLKGDIYVNSLDDAKNFQYQFDVRQHLIQLKFKVNLFTLNEFMPYLTLGGGVAIDQVDNYSESPIPGATVFGKRYKFTSGTTTQIVGSIGMGVDYWFTENIAMNVGYYYTSPVNVQTGYGEGVLSADRLTTTISTNSLELQVLYFF